ITAHPPTPPLFPYTTLFRSPVPLPEEIDVAVAAPGVEERLGDLVEHFHQRPVPQCCGVGQLPLVLPPVVEIAVRDHLKPRRLRRSEEHTSELQSRGHLVCRL